MLGRNEFTLVDGRPIRVVDFGRLNTDAGPDFFNSKVIIDSIEWAGNVEIHVRASDWYRHGHDSDPAYNGVILHVVSYDDTLINRPDGTQIPQLIISLPYGFMTLYETMTQSQADIKCRAHLDNILPLWRHDWLETLAVERIQQKSERIYRELEATGNDWEQAAFTTLARALGFGLNSEPFEMLARSIPLKILHKHGDDRRALEALLFGQAGLLDPYRHREDAYYQILCREYAFLSVKYGISPIKTIWKNARTRPQNAPYRRIAYLAESCYGGFSLLRKIIDNSGDLEALAETLNFELTGYWAKHYSFGSEESCEIKSMSRQSINLLIINCVAPLLYTYSRLRGEERLEDDAFTLLQSLPPERNQITRAWEAVGMPAENAYRSQALIQLKKEYCDANKCLYCRFGYKHLKAAMEPEEEWI